jgi:hypothetical protein
MNFATARRLFSLFPRATLVTRRSHLNHSISQTLAVLARLDYAQYPGRFSLVGRGALNSIAIDIAPGHRAVGDSQCLVIGISGQPFLLQWFVVCCAEPPPQRRVLQNLA